MIRIARLATLCLVAVAATVGVSSCGSSDSVKLSPEVEAALKYLPKDPTVLGVAPTNIESGPIKQLDDLGAQNVKGWSSIRRKIQKEIAEDVSADQIKAVFGNPLVFSAAGPDTDVSYLALQVRDAAAARKIFEQQVAKGDEKKLTDYKGASLWQDTDDPEDEDEDDDTDFNGLKGNILFGADSEAQLKQALDNAEGSNNASSANNFKKKIEELGDGSLLRVVGDAQRALDNAEGDKTEAKKAKFVQALGLFWSKATVTAEGIDHETVLETNKVDLGENDVPLADVNATFDLPSDDTLVGAGIADPDHLIVFSENVGKQISPQGFDQYQTGLNTLKASSGVDIHKDLLAQIDQISVALVGEDQFEFRAKLTDGEAFRQALTKSQSFFSGPLQEEGLTLTLQGSGENTTWLIKRGSGEVARFAIKGDSLVGSVGPVGDLPSATAGPTIEGVTGALAAVVDVPNLLKLPDALDDVDDPLGRQALKALGPMTVGVTETTDQLTIKGQQAIGK